MTATINLVEDGRVLQYYFEEPWSMDELESVSQTAQKYFDQATHTVHVLANAENIRSAPRGILRARTAPTITHPRSGYIAIVGTSLVVRTFSEMIFRLMNFQRARFFNTEDEAWVFLRDVIANESDKQGA
jgi:hypothetical protein